MSYKDEIIKAMELLGKDSRTIFIGQTVAYPGTNIFGSLSKVHESKRIELPLIEDSQMGIAIGLAINGFIPISIYPRMDFLILSINQLVNHLDKIEQMSNGQFKPRVIIRTQVGGRKPLDPGVQHSGDYTEGLKSMLKNIDVIKLEREEEIVPAYVGALNSDRSTLIIEIGDLYNLQ